ncbi:Agnestins biosynthesis cluster transcription factor AgnL11-like protein [Cladobotryum mycophilum]|uniref:Agnestins biosynthesis cluster transcription factor AgnL11-like protein n=1 Tax=Cladobotryum mycophilum TaxID=491253 RepID=A0ABR0SY39_9HYPO
MTPSQPRRRGGKRTPLSCLACRLHKLRCDRNVPCGSCIRYHREARCQENPAPPPQTRASRVAQRLAQASARHLVTPNDQSQNQSPEQRRDGTWGSQFGAGDFAHFLRELGLDVNINVDSDAANATQFSSLPQLLAEMQHGDSSGQLSRRCHITDGDKKKHLWRQRLRAILPSRSTCDLLLNYYLDHINWIFQIIHVPSFRRTYAQFWDAGDDARFDFIWSSLLFTVISLSALYIPMESVEIVGCPGESIRHLAHVWHRVSREALKAGDYEAKPCVVQLQTFCVTQLYWYATNNIEILNSCLGQAVRTAQALGLDKDVEESQNLHDEMRHRIWWDLVDSDTFQSICLDWPSLIRVESPGVPLPLNCNDDDLTETSVNPRPLDKPTEMSMNIFRAQFFRLVNHHLSSSGSDATRCYEAVRQLDNKILSLLSTFPWYLQLDTNGRPPRISQPFGQVLTWQHHILRTCISTQRIRMYRPFLSHRIGEAWENCVDAARDTLTVYGTLRGSIRSPTSQQKFFPQAYQIFSVAVTVSALLLIEGSLPIAKVYQQIKDMANDLGALQDHGCTSPVASHGRQVLLQILKMCDKRASTSAEDAGHLIPRISFVFGGERATRRYIDRLPRSQPPSSDPSLQLIQQLTPQSGQQGQGVRTPHEDRTASMQSPIDVPADGVPDYYADFPMDETQFLNLLNFDMTGLLTEAHNDGATRLVE